MVISIFTTGTNPVSRGDLFEQPMDCYRDLADEVIYMDGSGDFKDGQIITYKDKTTEHFFKWPTEFSWPFIGQQFQRGYQACTGDWCIRADLDMLFHENDFKAIREACETHSDSPALSLWKYQFILPDRYNLKSRLVLAVNKAKFGDRIRFDSGGDLCQVSLDGKQLKPDDVPEARVPVYNYEKLTKSKEQIMDDQGRMERAWKRHFGRYQMSKDGTDEEAYKAWYYMQQGRFNKPSKQIKLSDHPKYIQETIKNLTPKMFGWNGFGLIDGRVYEGY